MTPKHTAELVTNGTKTASFTQST